MGLLTLKEDRPTPKAVYNWRVYMAASVASWAACMIGYDSACNYSSVLCMMRPNPIVG
jgi:hypothetical protein